MPDRVADKTATDLEWSLVLERIAERAGSAVGAARLRARRPASTLAEARAAVRVTADALELAAREAPPPAGPVPEVEELLARLGRGGEASALELRDLGRLLHTAARVRVWSAAHREEHPALADALGSDPALDQLGRAIERAIEPDGSVSDDASPALREARRRVAELRKTLTARLGQLIRKYAEVLSGDYYAERDGRYVLPVRSDAHVRVPGIVLGSSASGSTLYVEPQELTGPGNELKVAEGAALREEARVIAALGELARAHAPALERAFEAAAEADVLLAVVRWAAESRSVAVEPDDGPRLALRAMRHPLLVAAGVDAVPNDIDLAGGRALIVSGPNAGGKTVALKCLGLAAWLVRAGLPIPAAPESRVGWFEPVLAEVGDDQSLMRSLSTFSAHVENLAAILERSGRRALVLLDEVAAGTDPEEGSALAAAVLEALVARGAAVAVTTHYERLKELGAEDAAFENASMGFDLEQMEPNFRLVVGVPGASSALAVARRHGLPLAVLERATALLPKESIDREELVRRLDAERAGLERARRETESELGRQRQLTAQMEEERRRAAERERARLADEARELLADVRSARAELRQATKRLRGADAGVVREVEREVDRAARHVAVGSALAQAAARPEPPGGRRKPREDEIVPGARVWLAKLGARAEVVETLGRGQVRVLAGALKLVVQTDAIEIDPSAPRAPRATQARPAKSELSMVEAFVPVRTGSNTLDLRGARVDEALDKVDVFVDKLMSEGEPAAFVLHGHGTGALKSAVREHLTGSRYVQRAHAADPEDGGDAFTVFWLKD